MAVNEFNIHQGEALRKFVEDGKPRGITAALVAQKMGIKRPYVYDLYRERTLADKYIRALKEAFGFDPSKHNNLTTVSKKIDNSLGVSDYVIKAAENAGMESTKFFAAISQVVKNHAELLSEHSEAIQRHNTAIDGLVETIADLLLREGYKEEQVKEIRELNHVK